MKRINSRFFLLFIVIFQFFCLQLNGDIITNPERCDGFGCQFYFIIAAATYAELNNHIFHYKPFQTMDHNYENDPDYLMKKEKLINFIGNFELSSNFSCPPVVCDTNYFSVNINNCLKTSIFKKIKEVFRKNKNRDNFFDGNKFHIAIAVRKPNQNDVSSFIERYTKIEGYIYNTYLKIIEQLRKKYSSYPLVFHIYSVGKIEDFSKIFNDSDIVFHINDSIENTFTSMVFADVLVTFPRSCFSYIAGLLSEGTIYHFEAVLMPVPSLDNWIRVDNNLWDDWKEDYEEW